MRTRTPRTPGHGTKRPHELSDARAERCLVAAAHEASGEIDGDDLSCDPELAKRGAARDRAAQAVGTLAPRRTGEQRADERGHAGHGAGYGNGLCALEEPDLSRRTRGGRRRERERGEHDEKRLHGP